MFIIITDTAGKQYGINPEFVEYIMETTDPEGKVNGCMVKMESGRVIDVPAPFINICEVFSTETTRLRGIKIIQDDPPQKAEPKL